MASLHSSEIHRHLESQFKILGINAQDLLLVLIFASIMNVLFGQTSLNIIMVFVLPSLLAGVLLLGKRNKPDDFLKHCVRFHQQAGFYSAGQYSKTLQQRKQHVIKTIKLS
ncbi:hypothetical protein MRY82_06915 [bacterium]|nr:hypothetical protein [bacterium]